MPEAAPADPTSMELFHAALTRDIDRAILLLELPDSLSGRRRRRLGRHLGWLVDALRIHHEGEDAYLWPLLLEREPASRAVLDAMQAEHDAIHGAMADLADAAARLAATGDGAAGVLVALRTMRDPLRAHLAHEEEAALPLVRRTMSHPEWRDFERRAWISRRSLPSSVRTVAWMADGATRTPTGDPLPAPVRRLTARIARVPVVSVWAGTPAATAKGSPARVTG